MPANELPTLLHVAHMSVASALWTLQGFAQPPALWWCTPHLMRRELGNTQGSSCISSSSSNGGMKWRGAVFAPLTNSFYLAILGECARTAQLREHSRGC